MPPCVHCPRPEELEHVTPRLQHLPLRIRARFWRIYFSHGRKILLDCAKCQEARGEKVLAVTPQAFSTARRGLAITHKEADHEIDAEARYIAHQVRCESIFSKLWQDESLHYPQFIGGWPGSQCALWYQRINLELDWIMVKHGDSRTCLVPLSLAKEVLLHRIQWNHPAGNHIVASALRHDAFAHYLVIEMHKRVPLLWGSVVGEPNPILGLWESFKAVNETTCVACRTRGDSSIANGVWSLKWQLLT
ncbi:hypothetical protein CDD81_1922 [Ophiocordyceps australis]|uniref:Uncharacterized protein n=1 Tax=Ophiocordyceps australis TaxID=1399860 RepID=A0A2C5XZ28_9HYPO|nr:hypothetical protein CDD81_1922 [Ophiocordyceps australis]